ncbi:PTS sugar transporter subunit IIA [bacterium]
MIGILVITHRNFGEALFDAVSHIAGTQDYVSVTAVFPGDGLETIRAKITEQLNIWNDTAGVVILVDMFGGTPFNASVPYLEDPKIEIISGVNMNMLLKTISLRQQYDNTKDLAESVVDSAKKGILRVREIKKD